MEKIKIAKDYTIQIPQNILNKANFENEKNVILECVDADCFKIRKLEL